MITRATYFLNMLMFCLFVSISPALACDLTPYFSPKGGAENAIVQEIHNATTPIHVAAYVFTSQPIALALEAAKMRGLDVRMVIDGKQSKQTARQLGVLGFPVRFDTKYTIFHHKFLVIGNTTITGSFNLTHSAEVRNAENLVVISRCAEIAADYEAIWQKHWAESK